jgi:hypothetical protein
MDFKIDRSKSLFRPDGVFSDMVAEAPGVASFSILEHAYLVDGKWVAKLQPGVYQCVKRKSPHFGVMVFQIMKVVGHNFMEIHWGSFNDDSDGCVLLGKERVMTGAQVMMITHSRDAFAEFMQIQDAIDQFTLTVC